MQYSCTPNLPSTPLVEEKEKIYKKNLPRRHLLACLFIFVNIKDDV